MDLKARKLELVQDILDTTEEGILEQIKLIFDSSKQDWWDTTSHENKMIIEEGLEQLDRGEGIPHEEVNKQIKQKFNLKDG
jgi:predicted transcriptional regulator